MYWDFSGKLLSTFVNTNFNSQFKNRWRINGNLTRYNKITDNRLLRGGPSINMPGATETNLNVSTDGSKKLSMNMGNYHGLGDLNCYRYHEYWMGVFFRPLNSLSVSFNPTYSVQNNVLQYVETTTVNGDPRYVFAGLHQKTISFTFRLNLTINPEHSLEYYGQPFISAGKYSNFKMITNTDAKNFADRYHIFSAREISYNLPDNNYNIDENNDDTTDYSFGNPHFNFRQFRSNLVFRWEYLPGSTLFLVWSQGRTSAASNGSFSYGNDIKDLFDVKPHNVFLLKFSYWFSL